MRTGPFYICLLSAICIFLFGSAAFASSGIGPFEISNSDSTANLRIQFAAQLRADMYTSDGADDKLTMEARRVRLSLSGFLASQNLTYKTQLSFAPNSNELLDMYVNYAYCDCMQLRFGQFKIPFTEYRLGSFQKLILSDWTILTRYFGAERQMGFAIHNGLRDVSGWGYTIGIFTGENARASHAVGVPLIYAEKLVNRSDLSEGTSKMKFHPEPAGKIAYRYDRDDGRLSVKGALSAAWDIAPIDYHDFSIRIAPEMHIDYDRIGLTGVGYFGFVDVYDPSVTKLGVTGALIEISYRLNNKVNFSLRGAHLEIADFMIDDARDRAAAIIAEGDAQLDLYPGPGTWEWYEENIAFYSNAGLIKSIDEITFGFGYKLIGDFLKWQNDCTWQINDGSRDYEADDDIHIRSQFQLVF